MDSLPQDAFGRQRLLGSRRERKMARSLYCYLRGDIAAFYSHLGDIDVPLLQGPAIWICGDCHFGNLGPLSDGSGKVEVLVRDLDQAVIGNPAVDLLRLALSLASVVSGDDAGERILRVVAAALDGYAVGLTSAAGAAAEPAGVAAIRRRALSRRFRHVARDRLGAATAAIRLGKRFWPLLPQERLDLERLVAAPAFASDLVGDASRAGFELIDAAYWVKGCSSLGGLRFALTVRCGPSLHLLDLKEATTPLGAGSSGGCLGEADRVIAGARALSPHLGMRMSAARIAGRPVFARVLTPRDLKLRTDLMICKSAAAVAHHLGAVVGRSHGNQMSAADRHAWKGVVMDGVNGERHWLFEGVRQLLGHAHSDYLRHCQHVQLSERDATLGHA